MNKKKHSVLWEIRGPEWVYSIQAHENADPVELATIVLEEIWGSDGDGGKFGGGGHLELDEDSAVTLGLLMVVAHENMRSCEDHILISVPMLLANAGFHEAGARLEKLVGEMDVIQLLGHLVEGTSDKTELVSLGT